MKESKYQTGILFSIKSYFSMIILVLLKYFWDAIDLTLDVYIFYRLERGHLLDDVIHRNIHVSNAIYAFAILGCLVKIVIWKYYSSHVEMTNTFNGTDGKSGFEDNFNLANIKYRNCRCVPCFHIASRRCFISIHYKEIEKILFRD